jgi:hypothetical protein
MKFKEQCSNSGVLVTSVSKFSKMLNFTLFFASLLSLISHNGLAIAITVLPPDEYWQVSPLLNYSDVLYAGWEQISVENEVMVYKGTEIGRTVRQSFHSLELQLKAISMPTTQRSWQ